MEITALKMAALPATADFLVEFLLSNSGKQEQGRKAGLEGTGWKSVFHQPGLRGRGCQQHLATGCNEKDVHEGQSEGTAWLCYHVLLLYGSSNITPVLWHNGRAMLQPNKLQGWGGGMPSPSLRARSFHPGTGEALTCGGLFGKYVSLLKILSLNHIQTAS